jgi:redox-sensing transcriptional repressor
MLSLATVARLPYYYHIFKTLHGRGREYVSSERLAKLLGIAPSLVRRDLVEVTAKAQKIRHHVPDTLRNIQEILGMHNTKQAVLIGVGFLGQALLSYRGFEDYGLKIVAAFDTDATKLGQVIGQCEVLPVSLMPGLIRRLHVQIAVLTVPADQAKTTADELVKAGIKAIWNFTPVSLELPSDIHVRNEDLGIGFALLSCELERRIIPSDED